MSRDFVKNYLRDTVLHLKNMNLLWGFLHILTGGINENAGDCIYSGVIKSISLTTTSFAPNPT